MARLGYDCAYSRGTVFYSGSCQFARKEYQAASARAHDCLCSRNQLNATVVSIPSRGWLPPQTPEVHRSSPIEIAYVMDASYGSRPPLLPFRGFL